MNPKEISLFAHPTMNLRRKILLIIGATILVMSGLLYWNTAITWLRSYSAIETENMNADLSQLHFAIDDMLDNLDATNYDWATWDETYQYIIDHNQSFVDTNLGEETFTRLDINIVMLFSTTGELVYGKAFDLNRVEQLPLPDVLVRSIQSTNHLFNHITPDSYSKGILSIDAKPLLVSTRPIITNLEEGPIQGTLLMGLWLDEHLVANFEQPNQNKVIIYEYGDPALSKAIIEDLNKPESEKRFIDTSSKKEISGYSLLLDILDNPAFILKINKSRNFSALAQQNNSMLVIAFILASLAAFIFIYSQLDRYLLIRLGAINQQVKAIANSSNHAERITLSGNDELNHLVININSMLTSLESTCTQLSSVLSEKAAQALTLTEANQALQDEVLHRLEVENELQKTTSQMFRLVETANELSKTLDFNQVLMRIADGARAIVQADGCGIYLREPDGKTLKPMAVVDPRYKEQILAAPLDINHSFTGQAIIQKHGLFFNDATTNDTGYQVPGTPLEEDEKVIVAPLIIEGEAVGAICLDRRIIDFTEDDLRLVEVFAAYASTALQNARAHDSLQQEVHERRQAERALRTSEVRYRNLFNRIPVGLYRTSLDGEILDANQALADMLGYHDVDKLKQQNIEQINVDSNDRARSRSLLEKKGIVHDYEMQLYRADGSIIWVADTFRAVKDKNGKLKHFEGSLVDITERKMADQALQESEARNRSLVENIPLGVYRTTPGARGRFLMANPAFLNFLGFESEKEIQKITPASLYKNPSERKIFSAELLKHGTVSNKELLLTRKDGTPFWASIDARVVYDEKGMPRYFDCNMRDISLHKQAEKIQETIYQISQSATEAQSLEELFPRVHQLIKQLIPAENFYVALYDPATSMVSFPYYIDEYDPQPSPETLRKSLTAYVIRHGEAMLVSPEVSNRLSELGEVDMIGTPSLDWLGVPLKTADNTTIGVMVVQTYNEGVRYTTSHKELLSIVSNQVAMAIERKRAEEQLSYIAFHDQLTGLPNRNLFMDRLGHAIKLGQRRKERWFAVLFLDLDHFKSVNDTLGHVLGDQLLITVARRLSNCLRITDTIARFGGDEFVILLEDLDNPREVISISERILEEIIKPFNLAEHEMVISTSIGVVYSSFGYKKPEEVLRDADIAMYQAKASGRGCYVVFNASMRTKVMVNLQMEKDMRHAIEHNEWMLHYQPILSLKNKQIIGFEALVRWNHPQKGMINPKDFIPFAEETGLIIPMGEWVINEACHQMSAWNKLFPTNPPLTVSVNMSSRQFCQPELFEQIQKALLESNLDPKQLRLEITESVIMENAEQAIATLNQLHQLGVQVHIDDFGTGYSSLVYLHMLPIQTIKIDQSFISGNGIQNAHGLEITRSIVRLAHDLKMETIAEGVETQEQLDKLQDLQCEYAQGFHIAACLEKDLAEKFLAENFKLQKS